MADPTPQPSFASVPELLCVLDSEGVIRRANPAWTPILGWAEAELIGHAFLDLVHPGDREGLEAHFGLLAESGPPARAEIRFRRRGKGYRQVAWSALRRGGLLFASGRDITRRWERLRSLEAENLRLARRAETFDAHRRDLRLLREMGGLLRAADGPVEVSEVVVEHSARLFPGHAASLYRLDPDGDSYSRIGVGAADGPIELRAPDCWALRRGRSHRRPSGAWRVVCGHLSSGAGKGSACLPLSRGGELIGLLVLTGVADRDEPEVPSDDLLEAVADRVSSALAMLELRDSARRSSTQDDLTRIHNRRFLELSLHREAARALRAQEPMSGLVVGIDPLRRVDKTFGPAAADELLKQVAWMLSATFRAEDIVCRWSPESFAVLLPGAGAAEAIERAEQVRHAVESMPFTHRGRSLGRITASVGVAEAIPGDSADDLFPRVEQALERARRGGRNSVESWSPVSGEVPAVLAVQLQ